MVTSQVQILVGWGEGKGSGSRFQEGDPHIYTLTAHLGGMKEMEWKGMKENNFKIFFPYFVLEF